VHLNARLLASAVGKDPSKLTVLLYLLLCLFVVIIIIMIIITTHIPYFTAVQLVPKRVRVSLTKHFSFTVLPKTF
jgi:hypothetical protein